MPLSNPLAGRLAGTASGDTPREGCDGRAIFGHEHTDEGARTTRAQLNPPFTNRAGLSSKPERSSHWSTTLAAVTRRTAWERRLCDEGPAVAEACCRLAW